MSFKFLELVCRSTKATSKMRRRRSRLTRFLIEQLEERRVFANLTAMDAWLVDSQSSERLAAPVIGELIVPMAHWTVSGASGTLNYDVEYNIDGVSVYRGATNFGNGVWFWYRGASYATAGTHTLRITIDPFNTVVETNESDNSFTMQFTTANVSTLPNKFDWPVGGVQGKDWTIINYVDIDPRPGIAADYLGGRFQYDGHDAIDITLANFEAMDRGVPILAAARGTVIEVIDGFFDRNQSAQGQSWNSVKVDHGNGWSTVYGHVMQNSTTVKVGDIVETGDILAYVGSSGNSTAAHLHFTVLHGDRTVETYLAPSQYWNTPLPYMGSLPGDILSSSITNYDPFAGSTVDISEGISDQAFLSSSGTQTVRFVFSSSHFQVGESWSGKIYSPSNSLLNTTGPFGGWTEPVRGGAWWFTASRVWAPGRYRATVEVNGIERASQFFDVVAVTPPQLRVDLDNAIVLDSRTTPIDIGSAALSAPTPTKTFQIWNHGGSVLTISSISVNGGFNIVNAPTTLQPGERRFFQVTMPTSGLGPLFGEVRIQSNDPDNGLYTFNVKGFVSGSGTFPFVRLSTNSTPYNSINSASLLDPNLTITSFQTSFANSMLTVDIRSGAQALDLLGIVLQGTAPGQVGYEPATGTVTFGGLAIGTTTPGAAFQVTFNSLATLEAISAVAKRIGFVSSTLSTTPRYIGFSFKDQSTFASPLAIKMVVQGKRTVSAPSFVVTNSNDTGPGSLRQAILDANANPGADLIRFVLPSNQRTISPTSPLPTITDPVTIDATTQPGYVGNPLVELIGSAAGNSDGLRISAGNSTVRGLVIRNFANSGIVLTAGDNNVIEGNFIGTNLAGTAAAANGRGIRIEAGSAGNRIGTDGNGTNDSAERNLISGNTGNGIEITGAGSNNNVVAGNLVGVALAASAALANANGIAVLSGSVGNRIGTNGDGIGDIAERNILSGNRNDGVQVQGTGVNNTIIAGNFVGTNAAGNAAIPNAASGIAVFNSAIGTRIGTDKSNDLFNENERNIVSGNSGAGIYVAWAGTDNTKIVGNSIGTDFAGNAKVPNNDNGIYLETATNTLIDSNVVSGNNVYGVYVRGAANTGGVGGTGTVLTGNFIGTNRSGNGQLGNTWSGLAIDAGSKGTRVGSNNDGINDQAERNLISGNSQVGVIISTTGADDTIVRGNYIGTDITGELDFGNGGAGVLAVGAPKRAVIEGNVISGNNGWGVQISDGANELHRVSGNKIGTNASGTLAVANAWGGVYLGGGAKNNIIGTNGDGINDANERNQIAGNLGNGIQIDDSISIGNIVAGNWIGLNAAGTGALSNGGEGVFNNQAIGTRIGTNGDGVSDELERNVISGNNYTGIYIAGGVEPIRGLTQVDQMIAGTLTSRTATATINQADLVDQIDPVTGNWPQNNPTPGGGGNDYAVVVTGTFQVTTSGTYSFAIAGDDGGRLKINGTTVINDDELQTFSPKYGQITLSVGTHSFEWVGFERLGGGGWELSVAVGAGNTSPITVANGWKVVGDTSPHPQIALNGTMNVNAYYSTQLIQTATIVAGNYIGVDQLGTVAIANKSSGIIVSNNATHTRIGTDGSTDAFNASERNVISGNSQRGIQVEGLGTTGTVIAGNYIGVNAAGTAAVGNAFDGILVWGQSSSNRIGTNGNGIADSDERNVVSGNGYAGISIVTPNANNVIAGNYVGTNATGTAAIGNARVGIWSEGTNGLVVGTNGNGIGDAAEGNLISGNGWDGIRFAATSTNGVVAGNLVGTNASGLGAIPNALAGVAVYAGNTNIRIGTNGDGISDANERNTISGNAREGVWVAGATTDGVVVAGNYVGVNINGALALGNGLVGVNINFGAKNTRVGTNGDGVRDAVERNIISANGNDGVLVRDAGTNGTVIAGNYIGTDVSGTIDLGNAFSGVSAQSGSTNSRIGTDGSNDSFNVNERNVISGNGRWGVEITGASTSGNSVAGNYIGVNTGGTSAIGNGWWGITVSSPNNIIGGSRAAEMGNLVSGNSQGGITVLNRNAIGNRVSGNWVGVTAAGTAALGNGFSGLLVGDWGTPGEGPTNTTVGGNDPNLKNVFSANGNHGIWVSGSTTTGTVILGNYIGTSSDGLARLANALNGISVESGSSGTVIGTNGDGVGDANERNVISGNNGYGVRISDSTTTGTILAGNWIGLKSNGTESMPNTLDGVYVDRATGVRIGTNGDGLSDLLERNVVSGNTSSGIRIGGGVREISGLTQVDQMIAGTLASQTSTGTMSQADLSDSTSPSNGNWSFNRPVPGGGGDDYAFVATGTLQVNTAGTYSLAMAGNDGGRLKINGTTVITDDQIQGFSPAYASVTLPVGSHTFEWTGFERTGSAGWELSVAVGAANTTAVSSANGWKVLGDPTPHAQISLSGSLNVAVYYSNQLIDTATAIAGNFIGTNVGGSSAIPNLGNAGILVGNLARNTRIGTNADGLGDVTERNIISGNAQEGIQIEGSVNNTVVAGNYVGSDATGALALGNGSSGIYSGILVWGNATNTRIGETNAVEGNFLAFNTGSGLWVPDAAPANSSLVRNNSFEQNALVGVDLGAAGATPNDVGDIDSVRNAPVITYSRIQGASLVIEGFARPGTMFDLYETANYANGFGQGQRLLATLLEGSADDLDGSVVSYGPQFDGVNVGSDTTNRFRFVRLLSSLPSGVSDGIFLTAVAVGPTSEFGNWRRLSPNDAPTDILLANSSVVENAPADTAVGALSAADPNAGDTFTYAFVAGPGSQHNANFRIDANGVVRTVASLNFESQSVHSIRIRATDQVGSFFEKVMSITIVNVTELTQPVQIGEGSSQRSIIRQLVLNFDNAISAEPGAFIVQQRRTDAGVVSFHDVATQAVLTSTAAGGTKVTLTFSGNLTNGFGALADGNYQLTVVGAKVKAIDSQLAFDGNGDGVAGGDLVYGAQLADQFFALFGDTNGDGVVGVAEFGQFRSAFGKTSSQAGYDALFDYEGDGAIGVSDFGQFRARFGKSRMPF